MFSSIGEPHENPRPLSARRRRLVVFGTSGRRVQVYRRSADDLNRVCREWLSTKFGTLEVKWILTPLH